MPSNKIDRVSSEHHNRPVSHLWRYASVLASTVLLVEMGVFKEVFMRAAGEEGFKILVVLAGGWSLLSLITLGLRNIFND